MRAARKLTAVAASAALIGAGLLLAATPAYASVSPTCTGPTGLVATLTTNSETFLPGGSCLDFEFAVSSGISASDVTVSINGGPGVAVNTTVGITAGTDVVTFTYSGTASGVVGISFTAGIPTYDYIINVSGGGGGGGGSSSASSPAPQTFELSLTPTDGTTCTNSSESGSAGTWIDLPAANDCSPPASKLNANLLGWATSPDFPVAIAQRQVDNGWGAYETFNDAGQLTGVFIPAGGATLISAPGNLYAVWSE